jgi:hypothetical protein
MTHVPGRDTLFALATWMKRDTIADAPFVALSNLVLVTIDAVSLQVELAQDRFERVQHKTTTTTTNNAVAVPTTASAHPSTHSTTTDDRDRETTDDIDFANTRTRSRGADDGDHIEPTAAPAQTTTAGLLPMITTMFMPPAPPTRRIVAPLASVASSEAAFVVRAELFVTLVSTRVPDTPRVGVAQSPSWDALAAYTVNGTLLWVTPLSGNCARLRWLEYDLVNEHLLAIVDGVNDAKVVRLSWTLVDGNALCTCSEVAPLPPIETGPSFAASYDADNGQMFIIAPRTTLRQVDLARGTAITLPATVPFVAVSMIASVSPPNSTAVRLAMQSPDSEALTKLATNPFAASMETNDRTSVTRRGYNQSFLTLDEHVDGNKIAAASNAWQETRMMVIGMMTVIILHAMMTQ